MAKMTPTIGSVARTPSQMPSTSQRWHSSRRRAPNACATSGSSPSSSPIANTADGDEHRTRDRPTAPIALAPRPPDHDRVDDPHRHPAELGHDDRRREREHRPQVRSLRRIAGYSMFVMRMAVFVIGVLAGPAAGDDVAARGAAVSRRRCRRPSAPHARGGAGARACGVRPRSRQERRCGPGAAAGADARSAAIGDALEVLTRGGRGQARRARGWPSSAGAATSLIRKFDVAANAICGRPAETLPEASCALGIAQYLGGRLPRAREAAYAKCPDPGVFGYLAEWRAGSDRRCRSPPARDGPSPDPGRRSGCPER